MDINHGSLRVANIAGYYWSRTAVTYISTINASAYYFRLATGEVGPSTGPDNRWHGFSLRCLALIMTTQLFSLYITSLPGSGGGNRNGGYPAQMKRIL